MKYLTKIAFAGLVLVASPAAAQNGYFATPSGDAPIPGYVTRSDYYRDHPHEDPEPFRCSYADDATCPGSPVVQTRPGDPRDDPEPFRCSYSDGAECGGANTGLQ
jgi:hypothetical protein